MIALTLSLAAVGLLLSAFFSGSETGFYRAARLRLVLDALGGDTVARGLVWLTNLPMLFVATILVGNNLANYITSLAIVLGAQVLIPQGGHAAELMAPLVLAPLLFVYGESLPKNLFLQAPNRLLRRVGPLLLVFVVLLLPISVLLWGLNRLLARIIGASPEPMRLTLARREWHRILEEGHEAGILHPAQRALAQGIFAVANKRVVGFTTPLSNVPRARADMSKEDVLGLTRRYRIACVPVESAPPGNDLIGYVRVIDLGLSASDELGPLRPLMKIPEDTAHLAALMRMQSAGESLALVTDSQDRAIGIVTADGLREPLFHRGRQP